MSGVSPVMKSKSNLLEGADKSNRNFGSPTLKSNGFGRLVSVPKKIHRCTVVSQAIKSSPKKKNI